MTLHVDIIEENVKINMLHVEIIYLTCRGQMYATINSTLFDDDDDNDDDVFHSITSIHRRPRHF